MKLTILFRYIYISVKVNLFFVDDNNKPIDAVTSVKILQDKATQEALAMSGITVANIVVPEPPRQAAQSNSKCEQL